MRGSAKFLDYCAWVKIREAQAESGPSESRTAIIVEAKNSIP